MGRFGFVIYGFGLLLACDGDGRPPPPPFSRDTGPTGLCVGAMTSVECYGTVAHFCEDDGSTSEIVDCADTDQVCARGLGCRNCSPGGFRCDGETPIFCDDGTDETPFAECDTSIGEHCSADGCADLCAQAEEHHGYIGCEYWPTPTLNSELPPEFAFAVVVVNPNLVDAEIEITREGIAPMMHTVEGGGLITVELPWIEELQAEPSDERSSLVPAGAYRLVANIPVIAYQFNALQYRIDEDCADDPIADDRCYSYSNDASLLLPTHVLTESYLVISRPTRASLTSGITIDGGSSLFATSPGFAAIVATQDGTEVEVSATARVRASLDESVPALLPEQTHTFALDAGTVLQLVSDAPTECEAEVFEETVGSTTFEYCNLGADYDLTGTEIRSSAPVQVISGHNCAFVPYNRWACDHLEESMFPIEAWGDEYFIAHTEPLRAEPNILRVVSAVDDNEIYVDPPLPETVNLDRGEYFEFETDDDVRISGSESFAVGQFLVGQDYAGIGTSGAYGLGDPDLSLAIPSEQYRSNYVFLAPETYERSFVSLTTMAGARVILDGEIIDEFETIGETEMVAARVRISGGVHTLTSSQPIGIVVYGFGSYTSYLYPGGLDLEIINIPF